MPDEIPEFRPFIFSCSGSADVGGIADAAARALSESGVAKMYCLAGIGARVEQIVSNAALAERLISIDGCENACSRKVLEAAGFKPALHLQITDLGLEKGNTPITNERIRQVTDEIKKRLQAESGEDDEFAAGV
jgi:uncharacterized metal-binding protein